MIHDQIITIITKNFKQIIHRIETPMVSYEEIEFNLNNKTGLVNTSSYFSASNIKQKQWTLNIFVRS